MRGLSVSSGDFGGTGTKKNGLQRWFVSCSSGMWQERGDEVEDRSG